MSTVITNHREIYITHIDMRRLRELINVATEYDNGRDREYLSMLAEELDRAHIINSTETPPVIITMNTKVRIRDLQTGNSTIYTLVFPRDADINQSKVSVLAPLGTALLGYRVGDVIKWPVPAGMRHIQIEQILYQPEAARDYYL
jgi:regulator of nucleoside diphosphate kinase